MDPISNIDRFVLLLRQRLEERSRTTRTAGGRKEPAPGKPRVEGLKALAALEGVGDHQLRRAFIQTLLADQFGASLVNDAPFQQIVSRVTEAIEQDPKSAQLLSRLVADIRTSHGVS